MQLSITARPVMIEQHYSIEFVVHNELDQSICVRELNFTISNHFFRVSVFGCNSLSTLEQTYPIVDRFSLSDTLVSNSSQVQHYSLESVFPNFRQVIQNENLLVVWQNEILEIANHRKWRFYGFLIMNRDPNSYISQTSNVCEEQSWETKQRSKVDI